MFPAWHNRGLWWINSKLCFFRQTSLSANSIKEDQNIFWPKALLAFYHRWEFEKFPGRENKSASECNSFTGEGSNFGLFALPLLTKDQIQLALSFSLTSALYLLIHFLSLLLTHILKHTPTHPHTHENAHPHTHANTHIFCCMKRSQIRTHTAMLYPLCCLRGLGHFSQKRYFSTGIWTLNCSLFPNMPSKH